MNPELSRVAPVAETATTTRAARAKAKQKTGMRLIIAGFVLTILGVVLYCVATFAGGVNAELGEILFENAQPFARATLGVLGAGTLIWLVGSIIYASGALDIDEESPPSS